MKTFSKTELILPAFALSLILALALLLNHPSPADASVAFSNEYNATTTDSSTVAGTTLIKTGNGSLGQVTITGANTGTISLYNATTSDITKRAASMATSTIIIAQFPASAPAGTYTFDAQFTNGLIYVLSGTAPTSTITTR